MKETIREYIKRKKETNNKGLLSMIRKLSMHFREFEGNNIHKVNICQWFDLLSIVRHCVVHNREVISPRFLKYLETHKSNAMFDRHFNRKRIDGEIRIFLQPDIASDIMNWLNSFAHFIFVSLSKEAGLSLKVSSYIPRSIERFRIA